MSRLSTIFALFLMGSAWATSFYERPFPETVQDAPHIIRGKIGASSAGWGVLKDGSKQIFTYTELEVGETFKGGKTDGKILVRELGGRVGSVGVEVSGTADFSPGEDVVVFLDPVEKGPKGLPAYPLVGLMMGKFNVEKNADGEEVLKGPALGSSTHPALRGHEHQVYDEHDPKAKAEWTLADLRKVVAEQARAPAPENSPAAAARAPSDPQTPEPAPGISPVPARTADSALGENPPSAASPASSGSTWMILAGGLVLAAALFYTFRRKRP